MDGSLSLAATLPGQGVPGRTAPGRVEQDLIDAIPLSRAPSLSAGLVYPLSLVHLRLRHHDLLSDPFHLPSAAVLQATATGGPLLEGRKRESRIGPAPPPCKGQPVATALSLTRRPEPTSTLKQGGWQFQTTLKVMVDLRTLRARPAQLAVANITRELRFQAV